MSELVERVLFMIDQIPPGRVLSYGDVADLALAPTPRYVGQVLARHGNAVCWWRVLRADGTPAPHLQERQLSLLRAEGVPLLPSGEAVDIQQARWHYGDS
jgi:methylated-DNA-protein-cysteine methyltransferase related protein